MSHDDDSRSLIPGLLSSPSIDKRGGGGGSGDVESYVKGSNYESLTGLEFNDLKVNDLHEALRSEAVLSRVEPLHNLR